MAQHANVTRLHGFLDAYARSDVAALGEMLTDDVAWHVAGDNPFSGDYLGREAVLGYFNRIKQSTGGTLSLEPIEILANDRHGSIYMRVQAERSGRTLDVVLAEAMSFSDGRVSEYWALSDDQDAVDAFWAAN